MRVLILVPTLLAATLGSAFAGDAISREEAIGKVRAAGFTLVSKTEAATGAWDVWASKDGVPYEVRIDAVTGAVVRQTAVEADD